MQSSVFRINTFSRRISLPWNQSEIKIITNRSFSRYLASFSLGNFFNSHVPICLSNKPHRAVARALIGGGGVYSYIQVMPE